MSGNNFALKKFLKRLKGNAEKETFNLCLISKLEMQAQV
jgi:hypothetical protein